MSSSEFREEDSNFVTVAELNSVTMSVNSVRDEIKEMRSDLMKVLQVLQDQAKVAKKNDDIQNETLEEASRVAEMKRETVSHKDKEKRKIPQVESNVEATQQNSENVVNEPRTSETSNAQDFMAMQEENKKLKEENKKLKEAIRAL
ncbi:hypothetical protein C6P45_000407, partial [Maudiozyma exigua]